MSMEFVHGWKMVAINVCLTNLKHVTVRIKTLFAKRPEFIRIVACSEAIGILGENPGDVVRFI